jgi:hypothetical protein
MLESYLPILANPPIDRPVEDTSKSLLFKIKDAFVKEISTIALKQTCPQDLRYLSSRTSLKLLA